MSEHPRNREAGLEAKVDERTAALATSEALAVALADSAPIGIHRTDADLPR